MYLYYLNNREILDITHQTNNHTTSHHTPLQQHNRMIQTIEATPAHLTPGDHIYVYKGFLNTHHGIYAGYQGATHWVVHAIGDDKVVQTSLEQFLDGGQLCVAKYNSSTIEKVVRRGSIVYTEESNDVQTVVTRALESVDAVEHNLWIRDSESFARFCKCGTLNTPAPGTASNNSTSTKIKGTVAASLVGASIGFTVAGPVGLVVGTVIGAGIGFPASVLVG
jgi:hypothetical protein